VVLFAFGLRLASPLTPLIYLFPPSALAASKAYPAGYTSPPPMGSNQRRERQPLTLRGVQEGRSPLSVFLPLSNRLIYEAHAILLIGEGEKGGEVKTG